MAIFSNLGEAYLDLGELHVAFESFQKSLALCEEFNDNVGLANNFFNIGNVLFEKADCNRAEKNYLKSLSIFEAIKDNS